MLISTSFVHIFQTQAGKYYSVKYVPEKLHFFETATTVYIDSVLSLLCYDQHQQPYTSLYVLSLLIFPDLRLLPQQRAL